MACRTLIAGDGIFAISCGGRQTAKRCSTPNCTGTQVALCDYPVHRAGKDGTCDKSMCATHRTTVGEDRDYCPPHVRRAAEDRSP